MSKSFSIFLFIMLAVWPAYADLCQKSSGSIAPCANVAPPNGWVACGSVNGESVWCHPSQSAKTDGDKAEKPTKKPRRFYAGFSLGYAASVDGGMTADYAAATDAYMTLGSFRESEFQIGTRVVPVQVSFGANLANGLRIDISHTRYSGISMPGLARTYYVDNDGPWPFPVNGGDVSGNATMLNAYYDLDRLTGRFLTGIISPYVGVGIGFGTNTISDYTIYHDATGGSVNLTYYSNPSALHSGGTVKNNLAYMFEAGGTSELFDRLRLDVFVRWMNLGRVETDGNILLKQTVSINLGPSYSETRVFEDRRESGNLSILDIGARLRFLF